MIRCQNLVIRQKKSFCQFRLPSPQMRLLVALVLLMLGVSACGPLKMTLQAELPHRDAAGKVLPIAVRLYQLSSKEQFEKADFLSLAKNDQKLLEKDILWRKEIMLFPNSEQVIKEERKKGAGYFAVMALFREKGETWRQVVDLNKLWILSVKVRIQERTVTAN